MKVRLNVATKPLENNRRFLLSAGTLGVLSLGLLIILSVQARDAWRASSATRKEIGEREASMRQLREDRKELEAFFKKPDKRVLMDRAAFLNSLIEQRGFPWTRVFMDLERLLPEGVRVVKIAPRMKDGRVEVQMTVGAVSDEAEQKFLRTLDEAREFTGVQVLGEARPNRAGEAERVLLDLVAYYAVGGS